MMQVLGVSPRLQRVTGQIRAELVVDALIQKGDWCPGGLGVDDRCHRLLWFIVAVIIGADRGILNPRIVDEVTWWWCYV